MIEDDETKPAVVVNAPYNIWLCFGDLSDVVSPSVEYRELYREGDVSWCADQIDESDVQYVRHDLYADQLAENVRLVGVIADKNAEIEAMEAELMRLRHLALSVDTGLVNMSSTLESYASPADALRALIEWEVAVATDPLVNGEQELVDSAELKELRNLRSKQRQIAQGFNSTINYLSGQNESLKAELAQLREIVGSVPVREIQTACEYAEISTLQSVVAERTKALEWLAKLPKKETI